MDATNIAILVGAGSAAGGSILTLLVTKGVDGWLKLRGDKRIDVTRETADLERSLRYIIDRQDVRITALEADLNKIHELHNDCERKHSELIVKLSFMEKEISKRTRRDKKPPDASQPGSAA